MPEPKIAPKPRKPPHPGKLMARIRELAKEGKYSYHRHAFDRKSERSEVRRIDISDVLEVLRLGEIVGKVTEGENPGDWKCKVTAKPSDSTRELGVVTVVVQNRELLFVTIEWEDAK